MEDVDLSQATGYTERNEKGYRYRHGSTSGYTSGCRCDFCRAAVRQYRREKSAKSPSLRTNTTGHLPRDSWRKMWVQAVESAGLDWVPTTHDMRHAHATWLLKSGVDLHTVKERLGHASITTTEQYLHRMNMEDDKVSSVIGTMLAG
jgi:integrase